MRRARLVAAAAVVLIAVTGCGFKGAYSLPLPGGAAHGKTYHVTAIFADVQDLTVQAAVRVNDVAVGDVTSINIGTDPAKAGYLKALVGMSINQSVSLPSNAVATLEQTTLLGEKFVGLAPPTAVAAVGRLANNAVIDTGSSSQLPSVEEVFGLLSQVLNGSDLADLQTINIEVSKALAGREQAVRGALTQLNTFVTGLAQQKQEIVRALDQLNRFSGALAQQNSTIATALDDLGPGLRVLADERAQFTALLTDLSHFGKVATHVITASRTQTVQGLRDLQPILRHLAAAGKDLPRSLEILVTFPFPRDSSHQLRSRPEPDADPLRGVRQPQSDRPLQLPLRSWRAGCAGRAAARRAGLPQGRLGAEPDREAEAPGELDIRRRHAGRLDARPVLDPAIVPSVERTRAVAQRPAGRWQAMIRTITKVQLLIFSVLTLVGITYVGASYVGINPLHKPYTVYLNLPSTGGIFTNADVAERGVVIGKVGSVNINPDHSGVKVGLSINNGEKIPSTGLTATITNLSAVGEQYVELEPAAAGQPYLTKGQTIAAMGTIPTDDAKILLHLKQLLDSVNVKQLRTVVTELGKGFANLGPSLQRLIDNGDALTQSAVDALPETLKLIDDGRTVLDTQNDVSAELKAFAASFSAFSGEVAAKDPALRSVFDNGVKASKQLETLLQDNEPVLPVLLNNLNTFTGIQDIRLPQTRAVLELFPAIVGDSFYALPKPGPNGISTARFGLVTDNGSFCEAGHSSTTQRSNLAKDWGGSANLDAYCHGNNTALDAAGLDLRGSRNVPHPKGDHSNVNNSDKYPGPGYPKNFPGAGKVGACGTPKCPTKAHFKKGVPDANNVYHHATQTVIPVPYDPTTGVVEGLNGKLYQLGLNGPVEPAFGSSSYTWLLIAPTMR
jgi:phospholipid/cholesterol/gamma-HCH transport system substrate-binding protein